MVDCVFFRKFLLNMDLICTVPGDDCLFLEEVSVCMCVGVHVSTCECVNVCALGRVCV